MIIKINVLFYFLQGRYLSSRLAPPHTGCNAFTHVMTINGLKYQKVGFNDSQYYDILDFAHNGALKFGCLVLIYM